jgi:hypothetical protein
MAQDVLDRLREVVLDERRKLRSQEAEPRARVYVTPSGRVVIGDPVESGEERMLSEVHPAVFAAPKG